ncbi:hypothetical protein NPIL_691051 [Nephila pilipes]|uniref:Uncharacterized protein n=1 Tax=Nephila pilipes TaxID=299642 RepID=A0A8X6P9J2_NEPPI|nr:hypothetical protein NPIL_691051 [Nephila pilipes]
MEAGVPQVRCVHTRNENKVVRTFQSHFLYAEIPFARWHNKHVRAHRTTSCLIDGHTYRSATIFRDALTPGCESACRLFKISRVNSFGTGV